MADIAIDLSTLDRNGKVDIGSIITGNGETAIQIESTLASMNLNADNQMRRNLTVSLAQDGDTVTEAILTAHDEAEQAKKYASEAKQAAENAQEYALRTSAAVNNLNSDVGEIEDAVMANRQRISALEVASGNHVASAEVENGIAYFFNEEGDTLFELTGIGGGGGSGGGSGGGGETATSVVTLTNNTGWASSTIAQDTDAILNLSWNSIEDGVETGDGTMTVNVNGVVKETKNVIQGAFSVNVKDYLATGSNKVVITVTDSYGKSKYKNFTITVEQLLITSSFDDSEIQSGVVTFPYTPYGAFSKTIHFEIDGTETETVVTSSSGRQMNAVLRQQSHGAHSLKVWFTADINGQTVYSNTLYYDIIWVTSGNSTPIISSSYSQNTVDQYSTISIPFMVYSPDSMVSSVTIRVDGIVAAQLPEVGREMNSITIRMDDEGTHTIAIQSGTAQKLIGIEVTPVAISAHAETENLALYLTSTGRSNLEGNPEKWAFTSQDGEIDCELNGFNFVSNGWVTDSDNVTALRVNGGASVEIPYKPYATDFRQGGKTIEIEFAARDVRDYDANIITCMNGGRGFNMTAQQCTIAGEQSSLGMEYKDEEHIRVAFTYGKRSETRLLLCYVNGIVSGAMQYPDDDDFAQIEPVGIHIGHESCTVDVYNIRIYDNDLTFQQIEDNWVADTQDGVLMLERFGRNNVRDGYGNVVISKLPGDLPYMTLIAAELPQFKGDEKKCDGSFVNPLDPSKNFSFEGATINVQGTSSQYYEVKNFKMKFKTGFITSNGTVIGTYAIRDDSIPVSTFTMKADVASSEGANNTVLARLFNDANPYKTPAQEEDSRIRQAIDGFPMVIFWRNTGSNSTGFVGKYNFNNDKGTEAVFGFETPDESWEFKNNTSGRMLFRSADFDSMGEDENGDPIPDWLNDFEARFPDTKPAYTDNTQLRAFWNWAVSTNTEAATNEALPAPVTYGETTYSTDNAEYRLAKFRNELGMFAEIESFTFYYLFTYVMLLMDNRAKNMFMTFVGTPITDEDKAAHPELKGMIKKATLPAYDFDSGLGINNEGKLAYPFYLEDIDQWKNADVFNGQKSVLWQNFRATFWPEIREMYQSLRSSGALSAEKTMEWFTTHQSKWPEAIFNEDAYYKYLRPAENGDMSYLGMVLGSKETQRNSFVAKRFRYIDSQMFAGDAMKETVVVRAYDTASMTLTPIEKTYLHVRYGSYDVTKRATDGEPYTMNNPASFMDDTECIVYLAGSIADFGDLSGLQIGYGDFHNATKTIRLQIGNKDSGYDNPHLEELNIGSLKLLQVLDVRNCSGLGTKDQKNVDVSGCADIREVYMTGTNISGVTLPNGGFLTKLHLPGTISNLTIRNQTALSEFVCPDYSHITTLWLENPAAIIDTAAIVAEISAGSRVRIYNFHWEMDDLSDVSEMFDRLDTMRGMDQNGNNTDHAQVYGTITVDTAYGNQLAPIQARFPDVTINYNHVISNVYYYSWDGETLLATKQYIDGEGELYTGQPSRESNAQYDYTFEGWSLNQDSQNADPNALANIVADRKVYAAYSRTTRTYTATFVRSSEHGGGTLYTQQNVPYGETPVYNGSTPTSTKSDGGIYSFDRWEPEPGPIEGNTTYTAVFYDSAVHITYMNGNTVFGTEKIVSGSDGRGPGSTPTKESTVSKEYTFAGWTRTEGGTTAESNALTNVTSDRTVWAVFTESARKYTITFVRASEDGGGTLNTQQVAYGTIPVYSGSTPTTTKSGEFNFAGWTPDLVAVTGAATYTAVFKDASSPVLAYLKRTITEYDNDEDTKLDSTAFQGCSALTRARSAATTLEANAFNGCSALTTVEFTNTVTIPASMFNNLSKLNALILDSETMCTLANTNAFNGTAIATGNGAIYVPASLVDTYKANANWGNYYIYPISAYPVTDFSSISDDWTTILGHIANGTVSEHYTVGDTKQITMKNGQKYYAVLGKIDADPLSSDPTKKAATGWILKSLWSNTSGASNSMQMNSTNTTVGGWGESKLRTDIAALLEQFPDELQAAIKTVNKPYYRFEDTSVQVAEDKLWIPSMGELKYSGTNAQYVAATEANSVDYTGAFGGKTLTNGGQTQFVRTYNNGSAYYWWLRSAYSATFFCMVFNYGNANNNGANNVGGVLLGFCI